MAKSRPRLVWKRIRAMLDFLAGLERDTTPDEVKA